MSTQDESKFCEIFDRLRETEAQTREQNERIGGLNSRISELCTRLDNFADVTDKFFELEEKRHASDEERFKLLCEHEKRLADKASDREQQMWKVITILIGCILAIALGPKVAKDVISTCTGKPVPVSYFSQPIIAPPNNSLEILRGNEETLPA